MESGTKIDLGEMKQVGLCMAQAAAESAIAVELAADPEDRVADQCDHSPGKDPLGESGHTGASGVRLQNVDASLLDVRVESSGGDGLSCLGGAHR